LSGAQIRKMRALASLLQSDALPHGSDGGRGRTTFLPRIIELSRALRIFLAFARLQYLVAGESQSL
ncbi:MAG TPA: hypothetical protein VFI76_01345, partial [Terrimicrobiaceae bacterium]|nr:hypothetical protein [Terrimicrobiaceae bacterium]